MWAESFHCCDCNLPYILYYLTMRGFRSVHKLLSTDELPVFTLDIFIRNGAPAFAFTIVYVWFKKYYSVHKSYHYKSNIYKFILYICFILSWLGVLRETSASTKAAVGYTLFGPVALFFSSGGTCANYTCKTEWGALAKFFNLRSWVILYAR